MVSALRSAALLVLLTALLCALPGLGRAAAPALVLERTIPLAGVAGRIDHMAIDLTRRRLFIAELGNGSVDVVDLATGRAIHRIADLKEPQGVGYAPAADVLAVASAGDGSVRLFRGADFSPIGTVDLGDDADNVRLDPATGRLIVGFGGGGLATLRRAVRSRPGAPLGSGQISRWRSTRRAGLSPRCSDIRRASSCSTR